MRIYEQTTERFYQRILTWSSLRDSKLSLACPISTKSVTPPESAGVSKPPSCCCFASRLFSMSPRSLSPVRILSGTAYVLPSRGSRFRFFRVKLPTSGRFSHSASVTEPKPRLRSANCVCSLGRSARKVARASASMASLNYMSMMRKRGKRGKA